MRRIILVQQIADLEEYYRMTKANKFPLVLSLTNEEKNLLLNVPTTDPMSIRNLYKKSYMKNEDGDTYLFLRERVLRELIEQRRICIPEFIDYDRNTKYVDYITAEFSVDIGPFIVFRGTKRLFENNQAKYSLQKNTDKRQGIISSILTFIDEPEDVEEEEFEYLCHHTVYLEREKEKEKEQEKKSQKQIHKSFDVTV